MPRELNSQLFSERITPKKPAAEPAQPMQDVMNTRILEEVQMMRKRIRDLDGQLGATKSRLDSFIESSVKSHQQQSAAHRNLENVMKTNFQDHAGRLSKLAAKVTEFRIGESKTQELVDRHNQLVQQFEARLQQVQKLASGQELKLMNYQSTLQKWQQDIESRSR